MNFKQSFKKLRIFCGNEDLKRKDFALKALLSVHAYFSELSVIQVKADEAKMMAEALNQLG
jgi:hypothetical protein